VINGNFAAEFFAEVLNFNHINVLWCFGKGGRM
jgi:hypothetical protein